MRSATLRKQTLKRFQSINPVAFRLYSLALLFYTFRVRIPTLSLGLFGKKSDLFLLGFPVLWLALTFYELGSSWRLSSEEELVVKFIASTLFLNVLHIVFSYGLLLLPEVQKALKAREGYRFGGIGRIALVHLAIFPFFCVLYKIVPVPSQVLQYATFLFFLVDLLLPTWHFISQSRGISFAINARAAQLDPLDADQKAFSRKLEIYEHYLSNTLILLVTAARWIVTWRFFSYINVPVPEWRLQPLQAISWLALGISLLWFALGFFYPRMRWQKLVFGLRYILCGFVDSSVFAVAGNRAIHGTEHLLVMQKLIANSASGQSRKFWIVVLLFFLSSAYLVISLVRFDGGLGKILLPDGHLTPMASWFFTIGFTLSWAHYYVDRQIFSMRRDPVRAHVAPLLLKT